MTEILISIKPRYVDMLVSGCKTVEIRKRAVRAPAGARIWIYATSPRQQVVASARLKATASAAPDEIWRTFGDRSGIDRREFDAYVGDVGLVSALTLTEIDEFDTPLCLRGEAPGSGRLSPTRSCATPGFSPRCWPSAERAAVSHRQQPGPSPPV